MTLSRTGMLPNPPSGPISAGDLTGTWAIPRIATSYLTGKAHLHDTAANFTTANYPATGNPGAVFLDTTNNLFYLSDGTNWLGPVGGGSGGSSVAPQYNALDTTKWTPVIKGDGATNDLPAINAAIAWISGHGGGTLSFPADPGSAYRVKPTNLIPTSDGGTGVAGVDYIQLYSNVNLVGFGGATIQIDPGTGNWFCLFYCDLSIPASHYTIRDLLFDLNAPLNTTATPSASGGANQILVCHYNGIDATVRNCRIKNASGTQTLMFNSTGGYVQDIKILNNQIEYAAQQSYVTFDNSCIYIESQGYVVAGNVLRGGGPVSATTGLCGKTAIEVHGIGGVVTGNRVEGWLAAGNLCSGSVPASTGQVLATGNVCTDVNYGFGLWATGTTLKSCIVTGNHFDIHNVDYAMNDCYAAYIVPMANGNYENIVIRGNSAMCQDEGAGRTVTNYQTPVFGAAPVNNVQNLSLDGNTVEYAPFRSIGLLPDVVAAPTVAPTLTTNAISGGSVPAGSHLYKYAYVTANGTTTPSPASASITTTGTTSKVTLGFTKAPPGAVTATRFFRSDDGGTTWGRVGSDVTSGTSFSDAQLTPSGAIPTTNTGGGTIQNFSIKDNLILNAGQNVYTAAPGGNTYRSGICLNSPSTWAAFVDGVIEDNQIVDTYSTTRTLQSIEAYNGIFSRVHVRNNYNASVSGENTLPMYLESETYGVFTGRNVYGATGSVVHKIDSLGNETVAGLTTAQGGLYVAGSPINTGVWNPTHQNMAAASYELTAAASNYTLSNGVAVLSKVMLPIAPANVSAPVVYFGLQAIGVTPAAGATVVLGIFTGSGALIGTTDITSIATGAVGAKNITVNLSQAMVPGIANFYWVAILTNGTWATYPAFSARGTSPGSLINIALTNTTARAATLNQSTLASFTPSNTTPLPITSSNPAQVWVGIA